MNIIYMKEIPINRSADLHDYGGGRRIAFIQPLDHSPIGRVSFPTVEPVPGYTMTSADPSAMRVDNHGDELQLDFDVEGNKKVALHMTRSDALFLADLIKQVMTGGSLPLREAIERANLVMLGAQHRWADRWIKISDEWDLHIYFKDGKSSQRAATLYPVDGYCHRDTFSPTELVVPRDSTC